MAQSIYITSTEGLSGKSTIVLGVLDALSRSTPRVGVFRAIARSIDERDYVLEMLLDHIGVDLDYEEAVGVTYDDVRQDPDAALSRIVERFKAVEAKCDAVVVVGSDFTDVGSTSELGYNARIAANLGAPVLVVLNGRGHEGDRLGVSEARTPQQLAQLTALALTDITHQRAELFAVITNLADPDCMKYDAAKSQLTPTPSSSPGQPSFMTPAQLKRFKARAITDGTYFAAGTCPTNAAQLTGAVHPGRDEQALRPAEAELGPAGKAGRAGGGGQGQAWDGGVESRVMHTEGERRERHYTRE